MSGCCGRSNFVHRVTFSPRWGELHVCSVGEVVGPPYSLESVAPGSGAITGATKGTVRMLFRANSEKHAGSGVFILLGALIKANDQSISGGIVDGAGGLFCGIYLELDLKYFHFAPSLLARPFFKITGMGFSSTSGAVSVRFACAKGFVEAEGQVVSDTEVSFLTPGFEKFGPMQVRQQPNKRVTDHHHAPLQYPRRPSVS